MAVTGLSVYSDQLLNSAGEKEQIGGDRKGSAPIDHNLKRSFESNQCLFIQSVNRLFPLLRLSCRPCFKQIRRAQMFGSSSGNKTKNITIKQILYVLSQCLLLLELIVPTIDLVPRC